MTDFEKILKAATELPVADTVFPSPQKMPYIAFLDRQEFDGDDLNHSQTVDHDTDIELYTERIDKENEKKIEDLCRKQNWKPEKDRTWLSDEKCFQTNYHIKFKERI